ncbi:MAG: chaperone modulator CbpM [Opitutaceae bacterium]
MRYQITVQSKTTVHPNTLYDHQAAAQSAGVSVREFLIYWNHHIIQPAMNTGRYGIFFNDEAIFIVRKAEQIKRDLGVSDVGVRAVLLLQKRIEELTAEVRFLRN